MLLLQEQNQVSSLNCCVFSQAPLSADRACLGRLKGKSELSQDTMSSVMRLAGTIQSKPIRGIVSVQLVKGAHHTNRTIFC